MASGNAAFAYTSNIELCEARGRFDVAKPKIRRRITGSW
jgi:hypothetical protein